MQHYAFIPAYCNGILTAAAAAAAAATAAAAAAAETTQAAATPEVATVAVSPHHAD